ncbi:alpha-amylase family glycosyl hydrolase [[Clostridium] polysaccharolyticum]|jgi:alpha-amylase|uniref:Glycosidase n=1 Tax=[Clostridium] polysaccharolyticum TaxID=29364 RepID=A0A1I0AB57_9FIRM|nr:alpha-amylase family glycosyl hydrolase [[Clostridium] polysaccharolyticum]SES90904.1 Glycosidase [[Clostridium] polysaccharolyticum]
MYLKKQKLIKRTFAGLLAMATMLASQPCGYFDLQSNHSNQTVKAASSITEKADSPFSWDNANVYFLLTDRFKNGNTSNDHSYNRGLYQNGSKINYANNAATFHGGDFKGITDKINDGYFDNLGVNAIWLSAPYEQIHGYVIGSDASESYAHYSYHGYYVLDYTTTDKNFGTREEFKTLVDTAHEHGIRIVLDVVMNHAGYNTSYDMNEYGFGTLKNGWQNAYYRASGINNSTYHNVIDYNSSSYDWGKWWGNDWIRSGLPGYQAGDNSDQRQNLSGLPDFRTESQNRVSIPTFLKTKWEREGRYSQEYNGLTSYLSSHNKNMTVTNCITYWLQSWVREFGIDGFRCDTAKHVDLASWSTLKSACTEALADWKAKNPSKAMDDTPFWMTGEVWGHGVYKDSYYYNGGFDSIINFSTQGGNGLDKYNVANTYNEYASKINSDPYFNVLSYISSHDTILARGDSIYNGSSFLLCPGGVQIYYGDETNRPYDYNADKGGNHDVRSDMNWNSIDQNVLSHWQKVGTFRKNHISVGAGQNASLSTTSGIAFSRTYSNSAKNIYDKIAACIGCSNNANVTITVSSLWANGTTLRNAYDNTTVTVQNGKVTCNSGKNGTILLEQANGVIPTPTPSAAPTNTPQPSNQPSECVNTVYIKSDFVPYVYAWKGTNTELAGTWPGTRMTQTENGYYKFVLGGTAKYNIVINNGSGWQTADITGLSGKNWITVKNNMSYTIDKTERPTKDIVYIDSDFVPYVYAWKGSGTILSGSWPGTKLTQKNADGYYVLDLNSTDSYNLVLNNGSGRQTADIKGLKGSTYIRLNNDMSYTIQ